ncbi:GNAT family N-acetyltransferase [Ruania halotolerans]|uniref:GNAT family N-acetyltransferase n=1 Tax=Ruania halotolerans TaxID=2897773 RepID=UPI001E50D049|nr:GNAT family N-acetyltransferase [Ruania halotolerans]UFU07676.1 GNAT family N-acetyltransferase [Ruania halotolerans]
MTSALIRPAHIGDATALHQLHCATWREAYRDLVPELVLERWERDGLVTWQDRLSNPAGPTVWVAHRGGEAVGLAWAEAAGPGRVRPLELAALYVLAREYGQGTAANLLEIATGDAPCMLWVARENPRAAAFYRKHGFVADGAEQVVERWGDLPIVRMVR